MVLYYQELTPANSTYNYLDNNLQQTVMGIDKKSDVNYEVEFHPGSNNSKVITGIGVNYTKDKDKVNRLKLYRNILVETTI